MVIAAVAVTGCFGRKNKPKKCHKPQEYQKAEPGPRVRVPENKEQLSADDRLRLPYGETAKQPIPKDQPCLEQPPEF